MPEPGVGRQIRAECKQRGDDHAEAERNCEPAVARHHEAGECQQRQQPAQEHEALAAVTLAAGEEVGPLRGVARDLGERPPARLERVGDHRALHEEPGRHGDERSETGLDEPPPVLRPAGRVEQEERDRTEREVHLARERDRRQRRRREPRPPPLERPEGDRQQDRHRPEQMARALLGPVRGNREREPAGERGAGPQVERPQPCEAGGARTHVGEEHECVPRQHRPEERQRPVQEPERPARRVQLRGQLGPERVGISPRRSAVLQLVPDEPEAVRRLKMVACRGLAVARCASGEEVRVRPLDGRPGDERARPEEERYEEGCSARAASSSTSRSGTSEGS